MKNKNGFTLIELLAVLVILITIMLIAIPSITSSIERNKDKQLSAKKELIVSEAELYASDNKININSLCVKASTLLSDGYVTAKQLINPKNDETLIGYVSYINDGLVFTESSNFPVSCR